MADDSTQHFDAQLGGTIEVPNSTSLHDFGEHRINEILMLSEALNEPPFKGQLFQRLPKHMRRRQMSHYNSRLPRRIQALADNQNASAPTKRPSRKYRRKPSNLLAEYNRRKRTKIWLETHIWHAKRFHMVEQWGYKLPASSTNKSFRANYRAIRSHAQLLDISYMVCIEIDGLESAILEGLSKCTSKKCGLTFAALMLSEGSREGYVPVFHPDCYPTKMIGNVSFLWRPKQTTGSRGLWMWVHPLVYEELLQCLCNVFQLVKVDNTSPPLWASGVSSTKVTLLKDTLNRYRLVGPLSSCVIADALLVAPLPPVASVEGVADCPVVTSDKEPMVVDVVDGPKVKKQLLLSNLCKELRAIYSDDSLREAWKLQKAALEKLKSSSPAHHPTGAVLGLLISDPRLFSPSQRIKSLPSDSTDAIGVPEWNNLLAKSQIWVSHIRHAATNCKPTDFEVNQQRALNVVPTETLSSSAAVVPILLIQQPGCTRSHLGLGAGWDLIVPSGWGLPVWRSLILRGARVGGLRESSLIRLEMGTFRHALPPDSQAGQIEAADKEKTLRDKYFRLPPAKRPNYIKLGVYRPFSAPWELITSGSLSVVLRDYSTLIKLQKSLTTLEAIDVGELDNMLVPVRLRCLQGRPQPLARIYLPDKNDLLVKTDLVEPIHDDDCASKRKEQKKHRQKLLKQWKIDRKMEKKGEQAKWDKEEVEKLRNSWKEMEENLWLLSAPVENLRELVGFVTSADFAFSEGRGAALAYISGSSIVRLIKICQEIKHKPMMLVRNVTNTTYIRAFFNIVID